LPLSSVSLAVHVQHHPRRAHLLESLLPALGECTVVSDPEPDGRPSAIRTYLECLRRMPDPATNLLILQDDATPCEGFRPRAEAAIDERPDDLVALFLAGAPHRSAQAARRAHKAGESWVLMAKTDWVPTVALAWPRARASEFLAFLKENPALVRVGDDNVVGQFTRTEQIPVWAVVPSLVEHPDRGAVADRPEGGTR
jgi:hypothetical protein